MSWYSTKGHHRATVAHVFQECYDVSEMCGSYDFGDLELVLMDEMVYFELFGVHGSEQDLNNTNTDLSI